MKCGWILWLALVGAWFVSAGGPEKITNGKRPAGKETTLKLTLDLKLGPEKGDDYLWSGPYVAVQADNRGHMFVTDDAANRIMEYDPQGKWLRQIGQTGQGPGEYQALRSFHIVDGGAIAFENMGGASAFTYYDENMSYQDRKGLSGLGFAMRFVQISPDRQWYGTTATAIDVKAGQEITRSLVLDGDFKVEHELLEWRTITLNPQKITDANHWAEFMSQRFRVLSKGLNGFIAFDGNRHIYTALAHSYEITKWDADMNKLAVIGRQYEPIAQSEEEIQAVIDPIYEQLLAQLPAQLEQIVTKSLIQRAVQLAEFPSAKFPISGLLVMEDGKLIVIHDQNNLTSVDRADLFSPEGKFLGSFSHPRQGLRNMIFQNGKAYTIEVDDEDNKFLVRYNIELVDS